VHGDDDDNLGWYHDGVKRTLTDEQVAMFRHSEIQRLLQQRRNADRAVRHSDNQANEQSGLIKQSKRAKRNKRANESVALQSEDIKLDYGQEKEKPASAPGQVDHQQHHHRKVVKYSDGLGELDQSRGTKEIDRSSGRISVSQTFHWPQLGPQSLE
jgi:hypothetical protein